MAGEGETVIPSLPEPGVWTGMASPFALHMSAFDPKRTSLGNQPSRKWPNAASDLTRSQMILAIASIGTERIAPGTPHNQNQNTSELMTRTGLSVNRLATSIG